MRRFDPGRGIAASAFHVGQTPLAVTLINELVEAVPVVNVKPLVALSYATLTPDTIEPVKPCWSGGPANRLIPFCKACTKESMV